MCSYNLIGQDIVEITKQVKIKNPICGYVSTDGSLLKCGPYEHIETLRRYIEDNDNIKQDFDEWLKTPEHRIAMMNTRGTVYDIFVFSVYNWVKIGAYSYEKDPIYPDDYHFFMLMLETQQLSPQQIDKIFIK